jgi:hypothetical protein
MQPYFVVTKRERFFALCLTGYVVILIPAIVITAHAASVEAVAMTRTATTAVFSLVMLGALVSVRAFSLKTLTNLLWRPLVAGAVMGLCVSTIELPAPPIIVLFLQVATGLVVFSMVCWLLWRISGRPDGLEATIFNLISDYRGWLVSD